MTCEVPHTRFGAKSFFCGRQGAEHSFEKGAYVDFKSAPKGLWEALKLCFRPRGPPGGPPGSILAKIKHCPSFFGPLGTARINVFFWVVKQ